MLFPNIELFGFFLKSHVQVGNEFLIDEISNTPLMKSARTALQEYTIDLSLTITILERRFERITDITDTITSNNNDPPISHEDRDNEEEIQSTNNADELYETSERSDGLYICTVLSISKYTCKFFPGME